jgi:hypothetical protein
MGDLDIKGEEDMKFFFKQVSFHESDLSVLFTDKHGNEQYVSVVYNEYLDQLCN